MVTLGESNALRRAFSRGSRTFCFSAFHISLPLSLSLLLPQLDAKRIDTTMRGFFSARRKVPVSFVKGSWVHQSLGVAWLGCVFIEIVSYGHARLDPNYANVS